MKLRKQTEKPRSTGYVGKKARSPEGACLQMLQRVLAERYERYESDFFSGMAANPL